MTEPNQTVYTSANIVRYYSQIQQLQPAEQAIFNQLKDRFSTISMLDVGVGAGRTSQYFLPLVKQYTGIDYSTAMIAACQQRFASSFPKATFAVMDARDLSTFSDQSFDLVWFSFNGIDYVNHIDRLTILQEIYRVTKPGGYFVFSSHNLRGIVPAFDYRQQLSLNPVKTYVNGAIWGLLRGLNRGINMADLQTAEHLILRDESHNFRLQTYYIRPDIQMQQLAFGFQDIQIYPWASFVPAQSCADPVLDSPLWLYYCCRRISCDG